MQLNKLILLTCLGMVVYFSCVIYAQPQIDPRIHQGTFPTSAKPVPKDMKGVKKYTKEEYEQKTGRKLVDDNPYGEEEYKDPDVILEYDYECFEGKCEYVSGLRILVLGGTQFLGRLIIDDLIKNELTSVTMLNRGVSANPFAASSQVKHIKVDRLYDSEGLKKELKELTYHDVVIDLTGLHGIHLVDIVQNFQGKCGHYIYVSCANVYYFDEGSQTLRKERAFTIPEEASIEAIQLQEKYGNELMLAQGKLTAENLLLQVHKEHEFPITIIRLPDVVGPYDNKGRHLAVHLSIQRGQPIGGANHKNMKDKFSVVYGPDVVAAINATITAAEKTYGKIINIAGDEQLTFTEYVGHLSKALGKKASFEPKRQSLLPSIYSGPLDNTLAKELLNWKPTPIEDWMPKLVEFFSQDENVDYTAKILMRAQEDARKARN